MGIRSRLPQCVVRAIPTCTLWEMDANYVFFYCFRPYKKLRVSFLEVHMANMLYIPLTWRIAGWFLGGRMISNETYEHFKNPRWMQG